MLDLSLFPSSPLNDQALDLIHKYYTKIDTILRYSQRVEIFLTTSEVDMDLGASLVQFYFILFYYLFNEKFSFLNFIRFKNFKKLILSHSIPKKLWSFKKFSLYFLKFVELVI